LSSPIGSKIEGRNALILKYYPMVRRVAYRIVSRLPTCVDVDDLVNIGMLGLIEAIDRFDNQRDASFGAYVRIRVQGAILDELRKNDWVPRSVRDRSDKLAYTREALQARLQRAPTESEVAAELGVTEERLREIQDDSTVVSLVSTEEEVDDDVKLSETMPSGDADPEDETDSAWMRYHVREALFDLPARERMIVEMYYFRDMSCKEIGDTLGVTESRISQIHSRVKDRLKKRLQHCAPAF
jgi:RNA polymerase sigma factor for flagellar operon FliA